MRRQKTVVEGVRCFRCEEKRYKKWEYLQMMKEKRREEAALPHEVWRKVKEYCEAKGFPPRGVRMSMEGWIIQWEVVTLVECRGCDYKGTKTQENRGQGFLSKKQLCNMWCGSCKEMWNW